MSYFVKVMALGLTLSVVTTGCSKKSKSSGASARPAPAATAKPAVEPNVPPPPVDGEEVPGTNRPTRESTVAPGSPGFGQPPTDAGYTPVASPSARPGAPTSSPEGDDPEMRILADPTDATGAPPPPEAADPASKDPRCGVAFEHNSANWAPGLPNPPSQARICTGGLDRKLEQDETFRCDGNEPVYTDARQDGLMAISVEAANAIPSHLDKGSRELARRIHDVKYEVGQGVRVQMKYIMVDGEDARVELRGARGARGETGIRLQATSAPANVKFSAVLTCADEDGSCRNAILRLQQHARSGRIVRVAHVVLRSGDAHVTMSEQDRIGFRSIENRGHGEFAEYLSNTSFNTCVAVLREIRNGDRQLPACAYHRLQKICGRAREYKRPAALSFEFRSWSVAYGKAGFEFEMVDHENTRFRVQGPLISGKQTPAYDKPLRVTGSLGSAIKQAILVSNDGGGNLNLQIDFEGGAHTRISITTLMQDVRYNAEQTNARARRTPRLSPDELQSEREWQQEAQDRADRVAARDRVGAPAAPRGRPLPPPPRAGVAPRPGSRVQPAPGSVPAPRPRTATPAAPRATAPAKPAAPARPATTPPKSAQPAAPAQPGTPGQTTAPTPPASPAAPTVTTQPAAPAQPTAPAQATTPTRGKPVTGAPAVPTRPLPQSPKPATPPAPIPAPQAGPRFEAPPTTPTVSPAQPGPDAGVPPREQEDNGVVQPRDVVAPTTPPPSDAN